MITEKYVNYETACLLKELGFHWPSFKNREHLKGVTLVKGSAKPPFYNTCYNAEGKEITPKLYNPVNIHYPRPTLMMALDFLEETHQLFVHVDLCEIDGKIEFSGVGRNMKNATTFWDTYQTGTTKHKIQEKVLIKLLYILIQK